MKEIGKEKKRRRKRCGKEKGRRASESSEGRAEEKVLRRKRKKYS